MDLRAWITAEHDGLRERFAHAVAAHVPAAQWRERAGDGGSSIAWLVLHGAWHEDLAMGRRRPGRRAAAGRLAGRRRAGRRGAGGRPGRGRGPGDHRRRSTSRPWPAYAAAVHDAPARWLADADLAALPDVPPAGDRIADLAGVTADDVPWLHAMWGGKPTAWFLQWEAVGHRQGHLGEMVSVRSRLGLSPF